MCVGHHFAQTSTNNVNKTRALLQTTGGKDEPMVDSGGGYREILLILSNNLRTYNNIRFLRLLNDMTLNRIISNCVMKVKRNTN